MRTLLVALLVLGARQVQAQPPLGGGDVLAGIMREFPLVETPARRPGGRTLVLLMSGDGDWAASVSGVGEALADSGYAVIGLEARTYMTSAPRTAAGSARDMERVLRHFLALWDRDSIVIAGFSRGADWAPIIASRLPADLRARIRLVAMLSPGHAASYEFSWRELVMDVSRPTDIPLMPIVLSLRGTPMLCAYGKDEAARTLCTALPEGVASVVVRDGGHRPSEHGVLAIPVLALLGGVDRAKVEPPPPVKRGSLSTREHDPPTSAAAVRPPAR